MYRDLKPENVIIDHTGHVKLVDFGLAKTNLSQRSRTKSFCGTPAYLAPEMISKKGHGFAIDWYGLGILTLEMLRGENPFQGNTMEGIISNV